MPISLSRRVWVAGGAAAAAIVLAIVLVAALTGGDGDGGPGVRVVAPAYAADPVPKPKKLEDIPDGCGVAEATLHTYVPGAEHLPGTDDSDGGKDCEWYSQNHGTEHCPGICPAGDGDTERILEVAVGPAETHGLAGSPDGDALRVMDPADAELIAAGHPERPVTGLGDEALYHSSAGLNSGDSSTNGTELRFRTGSSVVTVTYRGRNFSDDGPVRQVAEKEARPAVLAAAADVAKALHAPDKPVLTTPAPASVPPPAPRTVRPCELVPQALVDRLAEGATRERPDTSLATEGVPYGQASDTCAWTATPTCCLQEDTDRRPERHLEVTVWSQSEWRPGIAAAQANRLYLEHHDDARAAALSDFHAVRGLGDQAFAAYYQASDTSRDDGGTVVFRYRNLVAEVVYRGPDGVAISSDPDVRPLAKAAAVNGAYTAAVAVREALR